MIIYEEKRNHIKEPLPVTCLKCGSRLGIEDKDIIQIPQFDQREGAYTVKGFECPLCGQRQGLKK